MASATLAGSSSGERTLELKNLHSGEVLKVELGPGEGTGSGTRTQLQLPPPVYALGWVAATPPSWLPPVATPAQLDRYVRPAIAGRARGVLRDHRGGRRVRCVDAIEATAHRDGDGYVLNGVKWHVTSYNTADYAFFQAKLAGGPHDGEHAMFIVDLPSPGVRVVRTPAYTHTISHHHPIVAFEDVRVPGRATWSAPRATA